MNGKSDIQEWNANAETYAAGSAECSDDGYPDKYVWQLLGDVRDRSVLDVGCGDGRLAARLLHKGARVVGVDGSGALLAKAIERAPSVAFHEHDLNDGLPDLNARFDLAVSIMVVMDLPDIRPLFESIGQALEPDGRFVFSLLHPAFWNQKSHQDSDSGEWYKRVKGYLREEVWRVETFGGHNHYHRSISYYVGALREAGLTLTRMLEPPHESSGATIPAEFLSRFPVYLFVEAAPA